MTEPTADDDMMAGLYYALAHRFVALFNETRAVAPTLVAVGIEDDDVTLATINPAAVTRLDSSQVMRLVRLLLTDPASTFEILRAGGIAGDMPDDFAPQVVVHVQEVWVVSYDDWDADVRRDLERYGSLAEHPARREALVINMHTRHGTSGGLCPITGTGPERRATYRPMMAHAVGPMTMSRDVHH